MRIPGAWLLTVIALTSSPAAVWAQQSFADLGQRVRIGARVQVEQRTGETTTGRLKVLTPDEISVETDVGVRRFARDDVASVAVRRSYAGRCALIGAGLGGLLGYVGDSEHHDFDLPALLGAGAGALVGARIPRMKTVYRVGSAIVPGFSAHGAGISVTLSW